MQKFIPIKLRTENVYLSAIWWYTIESESMHPHAENQLHISERRSCTLFPLFITQSKSSYFFPLHMKCIQAFDIIFRQIFLMVLKRSILDLNSLTFLLTNTYFPIDSKFIQNSIFIERTKAIGSVLRLSMFQDSKSNFECLPNSQAIFRRIKKTNRFSTLK